MFGCSGEQIAHNITKTQIAMSGNKPPTSFKVANLQTMKDYVFNMNGYTVAMPSAKQKDFSESDGWAGFTHYNKDITLYLRGYYHITVGTSGKIRKYGERAIANNDMEYLRTRFPKKIRRGINQNIKVQAIRGGKENYPCIVRESYSPKYKKNKISYGCFKINSLGTLVKGAGITLTYNKPKDPQLAKQYTYADLKRRAKRMLDSLYIKDGW